MNHHKENKKYHYTQSPFYMLRRKSKLAELIDLKPSELKRLAKQGNENYIVFNKRVGKKIREIQQPKPYLMKVHDRIRQLLLRICPPDFIFSTIKKRGYKANAICHIGDKPVIKLDIKSFYTSTTFTYIYNFFYKFMKCEEDIAYILTRIMTYNEHIPTGSSLSDILTYYSHKSMFDRIEEITKLNNLVLTVYIDDIVISGENANRIILNEIEKTIASHGLKYHKVKNYRSNAAKRITGVIVKNNEIRLPNNRHLKLHQDRKKIHNQKNVQERNKLINQYIGRVREAESIDVIIAKKDFIRKIRYLKSS